MMARSRSVVLVFIFLLMKFSVPAQSFGLHGMLEEVRTSGFYRISITPALTALSNADLSDLRIRDSASGQFVPYILRTESSVTREEVFNEFRLLTNTTEGRYTTVIAENLQPMPIAALSLTIRNTAAGRVASLSGSDDNAKWYTIDDAVQIHRSYSNKENSYTETISFPVSNYRYYRVKVDNGKADPLNIIQVSTQVSAEKGTPAGYYMSPASIIAQKDSSDQRSYILVRNEQPYLTERIMLDVSAPRFYKRDASLYVMHSSRDSDNLTMPAAGCTIKTGIPAIANIPPQKVHTLMIVIDNRDNPPLKVTQVTTGQEKQCMIAWLEQGRRYELLTGNTQAAMPDYDLNQFRDSVPADIKSLSFGPMGPMAQQLPAQKKIEDGKIWLWPVIILAVAAMSFLTFRLLKDMNKKEG